MMRAAAQTLDRRSASVSNTFGDTASNYMTIPNDGYKQNGFAEASPIEQAFIVQARSMYECVEEEL